MVLIQGRWEETQGLHEDPVFVPLTAAQALRLREDHPSISPWQVLGLQVLVGMVLALTAWLLTGRASIGWSVAYGALAVVLPAALFLRGLTGRGLMPTPQAAVAGFLLWEVVKITVTVAMLVSASRLVEDLSWPALLLGLVVTMKMYWAALWFRPKCKTIQE